MVTIDAIHPKPRTLVLAVVISAPLQRLGCHSATCVVSQVHKPGKQVLLLEPAFDGRA